MYEKMDSSNRYDLAVIGGGPAGYTAGERAGENGLRTVLFEKKALGGVCLNEGCIPTKTLLYSAKILETIKKAVPYGIVPGGTPAFDLGKIIDRKNRIVRRLVAGVKMRLQHAGATLVEGEATLEGEEDGYFRIRCGETTYQARYVLLCTGSETAIPPIPGLEGSGYWTSREALDATEAPASLAVIGGGVIGMEFAFFFAGLGVPVKVVEMQPEILPSIDRETAALLRAEGRKKGIEFHLGTRVTKVEGGRISGEKEGKPVEIEAARLLVSIGRRAVTRGLGLETVQVEINKNGVTVDEFMQTTHPRIFACGDITGYSMLAHTAYREATVAVGRLLGKNEPMNYRAVPSVVYTQPELAGVGLTEEELQVMKAPYTVLKLPMAYSGRFVVENETGNGLCKLIIDRDGRLLGCHLAGTPSSEFVVAAGMAVEKGYTVEEFRKIIFPHPTVAEIIHECLYS